MMMALCLLVEHDVAAVLMLSDWMFVLDFGKSNAAGSPEDVRKDPTVRSAYLGDEVPLPRECSHHNTQAQAEQMCWI